MGCADCSGKRNFALERHRIALRGCCRLVSRVVVILLFVMVLLLFGLRGLWHEQAKPIEDARDRSQRRLTALHDMMLLRAGREPERERSRFIADLEDWKASQGDVEKRRRSLENHLSRLRKDVAELDNILEAHEDIHEALRIAALNDLREELRTEIAQYERLENPRNVRTNQRN